MSDRDQNRFFVLVRELAILYLMYRVAKWLANKMIKVIDFCYTKIVKGFKKMDSLNNTMTPYKFFTKAFKKIGFTLSSLNDKQYIFIKNNLIKSKYYLKRPESGDIIDAQDVYFLCTQYIRVRERSCALTLRLKIELLDEDNNQVIFNEEKDYSYHMKDEVNIYPYGLDNFGDIVKERFKEIAKSANNIFNVDYKLDSGITLFEAEKDIFSIIQSSDSVF